MHAVDEIDIGVARGPEQHGVSGRLTSERVGRGVGLAEVGFYFDDATDHRCSPGPAPHQQLSQQLPGDQIRGIQVKLSGDKSRSFTGSSHGLPGLL